MGNKSWLKLISLVFFASHITCQLDITRKGSEMKITNAESEAELAEADFSKVKSVEFEFCNIRTLTLEMQSRMAKSVDKLSITGGSFQTHYVAPFLEEIFSDGTSTRNLVIDPESKYKLMLLRVSSASLDSIPVNLSALRMLIGVNFFNNRLKSVDMKDFNGLNYLEEIELNMNKIESVNMEQAVLPKLETLDLSDNQIETINLDQLTAPKLFKLDLAENQLQTVDMSQFKNFPKLDSIYLNKNRIKTITSNTVALPNLRVFSFGLNQVSEFSFEHWNTPSMQVIIIEGNQLKKAEALATAFPKLERVWLYPNPFDGEWINATVKQLQDRKVVIERFLISG